MTAFHLWRIAVAQVFLWYGAGELLPAWVVTNAGRGDLAAGLLLPVVALWSGRVYGAIRPYPSAATLEAALRNGRE